MQDGKGIIDAFKIYIDKVEIGLRDIKEDLKEIRAKQTDTEVRQQNFATRDDFIKLERKVDNLIGQDTNNVKQAIMGELEKKVTGLLEREPKNVTTPEVHARIVKIIFTAVGALIMTALGYWLNNILK